MIFKSSLTEKLPTEKQSSQVVNFFVVMHGLAGCRAKSEIKAGFEIWGLKNTT